MQKLVEEVARHAKVLADQEAERKKQEALDKFIRVLTAQYTNAKAYANVVVIAGYAAFFAMWGFVRADIPKSATLWALLLMIVSAAVFVLFEVCKMFWSAWIIRRKLFAAEDGADPLERLRELEKREQRELRVFGKIWIFALVLTVPTGIAALAVLALNVLLLALRSSASPT